MTIRNDLYAMFDDYSEQVGNARACGAATALLATALEQLPKAKREALLELVKLVVMQRDLPLDS